MRRGLTVVSLLCAVGLAASGCAAEENPGETGTIPIGVNIELSGPASKLGESYRNGLEAIIGDVNRKGVLGGRKIDLIYRDNRSEPAEAIRVAKNLWDNEKVVAMIGPGVSPTAVPVSVEANKRKIPMISTASSTAVTRPAARRPYTYKTSPNNDDMARVQVAHLKKLKVERVAYIAANNAYGQISKRAFEKAAGDAGLDVVASELYNDQDKDYTPHITKMIGHRPDAIAAAAISPQSTILAKHIRAAKFPGPVIFEGGAGAELFLKGVGKASEGMFMVNMSIMAAGEIPDSDPGARARKEFFTTYTGKYGQYSSFATHSADALLLYVAAIEKAGSADPEEINKALGGLRQDGLGGRFDFGPRNHGGVDRSSLIVLVARGGTWVPAG